MKIIVFDLWGDYAHFRVPYTTSSPLTFPIPTKTALYGLIGAILGYDKNEYLKKFNGDKWRFAVYLKKPIKKIYIPINFINTKEAKLFARMPRDKSCRTQINMEFLKEPNYRIFVNSENEDELNNLKELLKNHKSNYTVYLGISECIANFKFIGDYNDNDEVTNINDYMEISSIIPTSQINDGKIDFTFNDLKILKVHIPTEMKPDRELIESQFFILEANGKKIKAQVKNYVRVEDLDENIIFF
jgi:CRISPR-associated protein Cas5h